MLSKLITLLKGIIILRFTKRIAAALAGIIAVTAFSGCSLFSTQSTNAIGTYDFTQMNLVQLDKPAKGQDEDLIETNVGTLTAVSNKELATKTLYRICTEHGCKLQKACRGRFL